MLTEIVLAFGTLFAIVNPVSAAIVYNSMAAAESAASKRRLTRVSTAAAVFTLLVFMIVGKPLMAFFGITLYAFRVAGGLYLGKIAFDMLGHQLRHLEVKLDDKPDDIAIIPLAIPLLAGPGAMTTVMVLRETYSLAALTLAILVLGALSWVILSRASLLDRVLGHTGTKVVERIFGLLVLVISVQFVFNGITGYLEVARAAARN